MDLRVLLESPQGSQSSSQWGHARALSSRVVAAVSPSRRVDHGISGFPSRLSHEAFPRGFPTRLSHRAVPLATVVGVDPRLKVEEVQGEEFSLEWTETSGELWEWWHEPGVPLAFPVESTSS